MTVETDEAETKFRETLLKIKSHLSPSRSPDPAILLAYNNWQMKLVLCQPHETQRRNEHAQELLRQIATNQIREPFNAPAPYGPLAPACFSPITKESDGDSQWCDMSEEGEDAASSFGAQSPVNDQTPRSCELSVERTLQVNDSSHLPTIPSAPVDILQESSQQDETSKISLDKFYSAMSCFPLPSRDQLVASSDQLLRMSDRCQRQAKVLRREDAGEGSCNHLLPIKEEVSPRGCASDQCVDHLLIEDEPLTANSRCLKGHDGELHDGQISRMCNSCQLQDHFYEEVISHQQENIERYQRAMGDFADIEPCTAVRQRRQFSDHMTTMALSLQEIQSRNDALNEELTRLKSSSTNIAVNGLISKVFELTKKTHDLRSENRALMIAHKEELLTLQSSMNNRLEEISLQLRASQRTNKQLFGQLNVSSSNSKSDVQLAEKYRTMMNELQKTFSKEALEMEKLKNELMEVKLSHSEDTKRHSKVVADLEKKVAHEIKERKREKEILSEQLVKSAESSEKYRKAVVNLEKQLEDEKAEAQKIQGGLTEQLLKSSEETKRSQKLLAEIGKKHESEMKQSKTILQEDFSLKLKESFDEIEKYRRKIEEIEKTLASEKLETKRLKDINTQLSVERDGEISRYQKMIADIKISHGSAMQEKDTEREVLERRLARSSEDTETFRDVVADIKKQLDKEKLEIKKMEENFAVKMKEHAEELEMQRLMLDVEKTHAGEATMKMKKCVTAQQMALEEQTRTHRMKMGQLKEQLAIEMEHAVEVEQRLTMQLMTRDDIIWKMNLFFGESCRKIECEIQRAIQQIQDVALKRESRLMKKYNDMEALVLKLDNSRHSLVDEQVAKVAPVKDEQLQNIKQELKEEISQELKCVLSDYSCARETWLDAYEAQVKSLIMEKDVELEKLKNELLTQTSKLMLTMSVQRQAEIEHLAATLRTQGHPCDMGKYYKTTCSWE